MDLYLTFTTSSTNSSVNKHTRCRSCAHLWWWWPQSTSSSTMARTTSISSSRVNKRIPSRSCSHPWWCQSSRL